MDQQLATYVTKPSLDLFTLYIGKLAGSLANSENPDEMPHKAAFHQGLHS